jgi:sugar phosphate isomerase/epimerase
VFAGSHTLAAWAASAENATASNKILVTVRDVHLRGTDEKDVWSALRAIGAQGVEVQVERNLSCSQLFGTDKPYSIATSDEAKRLADDAKSHGTPVTSFLMHNTLDQNPDAEIKWVGDIARAGKTMGVTVIRIDVVPRKIKGDEFLKFAVETCKRLAAEIADTGVRLGIENHGNTTNNAEFLEKLFDGVGSDRIGLTLDTGNFYWFGYPLDQLYENYKKFASRVYHTHCKNIAYPEDQRNVKRQMGWEYGKFNCPVYEGDIDFKRVVAILREVGYHGDLCIEDESLGKFKGKQREVLAKEVAFLKGLI